MHSVGSPSSYRVELDKGVAFCGESSTHVEGNHGTFFPTGWTWAQGIGREDNCSFSLIGGIMYDRAVSLKLSLSLKLTIF